MTRANISALVIFWFLIGLLAHAMCFSDCFSHSSWRKTVVSVIFGGPIYLGYYLIYCLISILDDFRNK